MLSTSPATALPRHIDPRKFAQQGVSINGDIDLSQLDRLLPLLATSAGDIVAELTFGRTEEHQQYCLQGKIKAQVSMICQRCLEASPQQLEAEVKLAMLWNDDQATQLPKSWDPWVVGDGQTDLYQVIEDELILSLPIVAYHSDPCMATDLYQSQTQQYEQQLQAQAATKPNPFQVLAQLKGSAIKSPDGKN